MYSAIHQSQEYIFLVCEVFTLSNKERRRANSPAITSKPIVIYDVSNEEEIIKKLKVAPFELTVKIAAAIGHVWQKSA